MDTPQQFIWNQRDWPEFHVELAALAQVLADARKEQGIVIGKARAIGILDIAPVINEIWVAEAVATAAIEGESLNLDAVRSSVARRLGITPATSTLVPRNIDGLLDVMADATNQWDKPLTAERLCTWQAALFPTGYSGLHKVLVGSYRRSADPMQIVSGPIGREKVHYVAPPSSIIEPEMTTFLKWFAESRQSGVDGIVRAGIAHLWFETLHPFEDGNGRVGRAIVDMALAQDTQMAERIYSMSRQLEMNRNAYYDQLERAQRGPLDITEWIYWFLSQFREACKRSGSVIDRSLDKARFWAVHSNVDLNARQRKVVNALLDAGPGGFEGGMSTRKYLNMTGASRATASRELIHLLRNGLLVSTGEGKATKYLVAVPGWDRGI